MDIETMEKASMLSWWEPLSKLDVPMPKTRMMPLAKQSVIALHKMGEKKLPAALESDIYYNARLVGYPLFMRTDETSCKHNWEETCYVEHEGVLISHIHNLLEQNSMLGIIGLPVNALVFREYIPMAGGFKAFKGMPVNPEWRYFAEGDDIKCRHAYWVEDAIRFYKGTKEPENWREVLKGVNAPLGDYARKLLDSYALKISPILTETLGGGWSIDFCRSEGGKWYFIDCAPADVSWHPKHDDEEPIKVVSIFDEIKEFNKVADSE